MLANVDGKSFITKGVKMGLSRTKVAATVYVVGLAGLVLLVGVLTLVEHAGLHLGVGFGLIAPASFGTCIIGAVLQRATVWRKLVLILVALVAIPLEILAMGAVSLMMYGLEGIQ
jgi:cytosine/uracil/thiamine/allantoin permease